MLVLLLALGWLVLTPICVWLIFGRDASGPRRAMGALTLAALQAGTLVIGFHSRTPPEPPAPVVAGRTGAPGPATAARATAAPTGTGAPPVCTPRTPTPEMVRMNRRGGSLNLFVFWRAAERQCPTATVALKGTGRVLRVWLRESAPGEREAAPPVRGAEVRSVPVRLVDGLASLNLRITPELRRKSVRVTVNGGPGYRMPRPAGRRG